MSLTQVDILKSLARKHPEKYGHLRDGTIPPKSPPPPVSPLPCPHRGAPTGDTVGCRTCSSGRVRLPVYACDLHGRCTVGALAPAANDVAACRWCKDRPRPRPPAVTVP